MWLDLRLKEATVNETTPRVLRVGIVRDGSIIHERLIPPTDTVTLGSDPRATFTVPGGVAMTPLFVSRKGRYRMNLPLDSRGRVGTSDGVVSLESYRSSRGRRPVIADGDRGKVVLGDVTVLFQMVDAPPMPARMLAGSFRPKLIDEDDPFFLGILSLCGSAAAVMMVYISTLTVPALVQFEEVQDFFAHDISFSAPVEAPEIVPTEDPDATPGPVEAAVADAEPVVEPEPVVDPVEVVVQPPMSPEDQAIADALAWQSRRDEVVQKSALLSRLILNRGEGPPIFDADDEVGQELLASIGNITVGPDTVEVDGGARTATDGTGRGLAGLTGGVTTGETGRSRVDRGPETAVAPPTNFTVVPEEPPVPDDIQGQVRAALQWLNPRIRSCYERRIKEDPTLSGRVVLEVDVIGGRVSDVYVSGTINDSELTSCVQKAASRWQVPGVEEATLRLPFAMSAVE